MTGRARLTRIAACAAMCVASSVAIAAEGPSAVADLLARMPAKNAAEERKLAAGLVTLGPKAIGQICKMLVPPGTGDDTKARYALSGLAACVTRPGAQAERAMVAGVIVEAIKSADDEEVKAFLIRQMQVVGTEGHVAALSAFLGDKRLCEPATQTMLAIGGAGLGRHFVKALPSVDPANRVTIINALGKIRARSARPAIVKHAASDDVNVRLAASYALANIGDPADADLLAKAARAKPSYQRAKATSFYLLFARRLADAGKPDQCAAICRDLIKTRTASRESNVPCAALGTLVTVLGERALGDLVAAMDGKNPQLQWAALELAGAIPGEAATARWVAKGRSVGPDVRARILGMLGRRGDKSALPVLLAAMKDKEKVVRLAAIPAAARLGGTDALDPLLVLLRAAQADEIVAARQALMCLAGDGVMSAVAGALPSVPAPSRAALLEVLGARRATAHLEAVFAQTKDKDRSVRLAAIRALDVLASDKDLPRAVQLLGNATSGDERSAVQKAAVSIARRTREGVKTPAQKKLVLTCLAKVRTLESLALVAPYLDDKQVQPEAASAAVKIACPQGKGERGLRGTTVAAVLQKAIPAITDARVRAKAERYLATLPKPDKHNLAHGKPVKTSVPQQGSRAPSLAVDGDYKDKHAAWFGARWPSWLQIDLGKAVKIDTAHVFFYWDARYYQYNVQVSVDGKTFKTVVDMSKNTRAAAPDGVIHKFSPAAARTVRINVLKNSANEAVHLVELKVYAEGTGPTPPPPPPPSKPDAEGFVPLLNGKDLSGWTGHTSAYRVEGGRLIGGGSIYTKKQYSDFVFRFEFKLTPGANSGVALRAPMRGSAAYAGMEIQILDDTAERYKRIKPYQRHGSIYGVVPAKRGHLKPVGEWNSEEITAKGRQITIKLNGVTIVDADLDKASTPKTMDGKRHPGLKRTKGHLGFVGHGSHVEFRNILVKELK